MVIDRPWVCISCCARALIVAMAIRAAAGLVSRGLRRTPPVQTVVRCMSGDYNPFIHSLDRLNTKKVCNVQQYVIVKSCP